MACNLPSSSSSSSLKLPCGTACCDNSDSADAHCEKDYIISWPVGPKAYCPPVCRWTADNMKKIPFGSMYVAQVCGQLSNFSTRVQSSPWNLVGIILQLQARPRYNNEETVVFTSALAERNGKLGYLYKVVPMSQLMNDPSIKNHGVMALRPFDVNDCDDNEASEFISRPPWPADCNIGKVFSVGSSYDALQEYNNAFVRGRVDAEGCGNSGYDLPCFDKGAEDSSISASASRSDCSHSSFSSSDVSNSKKYCRKLNQILIDLIAKECDKFDGMFVELNNYQALAAITGDPVAQEYSNPNFYTPAEMVATIYYRVGLLFDGNLSCQGENPYCCFDVLKWNHATQKAAEQNDPVKAITILSQNENCGCATDCKYVHRQLPCVDERIKQNVKQFLIDGYNAGATNELEDCATCWKKGHSSSSSSSCSSSSSSSYIKPKRIAVHGNSLFLASTTVRDLMINYYRSRGIDPFGGTDLCETNDKANCGLEGEINNLYLSIASSRAASGTISTKLNNFYMPWLDGNLIPLDKCPCAEAMEDCERWQLECKAVKQLSWYISHQLYSDRLIHTDAAGFTGNTILILARQTTDYLKDMDAIAKYVVPSAEWNGCKWTYDHCDGFTCKVDKHELKRLRKKVHKIEEGLKCLYMRTPYNSLLKEIIYHALNEAASLRKWLKKMKKHCCKESKDCSESKDCKESCDKSKSCEDVCEIDSECKKSSSDYETVHCDGVEVSPICSPVAHLHDDSSSESSSDHHTTSNQLSNFGNGFGSHIW
jgi:hypothetical protein